MYTKKYTSSKPHVKSAKISGGVAALWWPHGTTAIYETFARMSQPFTNNLPEVDFHGANGNVILGGDALAADRYTEARLAPIVEQGMFQSMNKQPVPMIKNFSEDEEWPKVLPAVFPRLLVNGSQGIGVSLAQVWLPHNFTETANLILDYIATGELKEDTYYPDFPTGGLIINQDELPKINKTGKGRVIVEARYKIDGQTINFYEMPYQVFIEPVIDQIKKAIEEEKIEGISEVFNKSDKKRLLLSIECDSGFSPEKVVAQLFNETDLRKQYNANQNGIVSKTPILVNLQYYVDCYIVHNETCIRRESEFDLKKTQERIEILEGLAKALEDIDNVIQIIKQSKTSTIAGEALKAKYSLTDRQVKAILDMRLSKLANMERIAILNELEEKRELALQLQEIIESVEKRKKILADRLTTLRDNFMTPRQSEVCQ
jgi:DNA gyrase subunit A